MSSSLKILEYAMAMEKQGSKFYLENMDKFDNPEAKGLFERLARVEMEHYDILKQHYDSLEEHGDWEKIDVDLSSAEEIYKDELKKAEITSDQLTVSELAIMRMAYLIENDFADFYKKALERAEDEKEKELLQTLVDWENEHRQLFYSEFRDLMENNWFEQGFYPF